MKILRTITPASSLFAVMWWCVAHEPQLDFAIVDVCTTKIACQGYKKKVHLAKRRTSGRSIYF